MTFSPLNTRTAILAGSGLCAAAFILSDLVNREMSPVAETVSRFVNTGHGWLVTVGLVGLALAGAASAVRVADRPGRVLLWIWAAGIAVSAVFPADPPGNWAAPSVSETVHGLAAWVALGSFTAAAVVLARRWRGLPGTPRALAPVTAGLAASMVLFVVTLVDAMAFRELPALLGVTERAVIAADLVWMCVAAFRVPAAPAAPVPDRVPARA
ncbi:DUF998 domain-containing protein [Nocardiopsis sp. NPDC057823]|uniref:DUF998 domain-containing protein n=1 Tax=Nocardiopsis sp. NPDC057823 TaxID=3346256 RepID=UPI00366BBA06